MVATPISRHLVETVFQYILPPNLPIPPHLLSVPSLERHHYLSISQEDASAYLCWPSSDADHIVRLMEQTSWQDTFAPEPEHEVRYTASDEDTLLAHVHPNPQSSLRVIFIWDSNVNRWGYHDCRLMPFPPSAHSQLESVIVPPSNTSRSLSRSSSPDSDYWGGYASSDTSPNIVVPPTVSVEDEEKAEAAYWASYGAVHGSGDSTVPSPRPSKQPIPPTSTETHGRTEPDPFLANLHLRLQSRNGFLSPKYTGSERSHSPQPTGSVLGIDSSDSTHNEYGFSDIPEITTRNHDEQSNTSIAEVPAVDGEPGVREIIKGVYHMWRGGSETRNEEEFIKIVKDVLYSDLLELPTSLSIPRVVVRLPQQKKSPNWFSEGTFE